jgi:hypothetical protein
MAPPPDHKNRTGEWDSLRETIDNAVKDAVKKALDGDSGLLRGTECEDEHREEMRRLVKEMRASMISSAGDLRQTLLDTVSANAGELRSMVREEVSALRTQITTLDGSVKEVRIEMAEMRAALYQGDTQFAVLGERLSTLKEDVERVRNTGSTPPNALTAASMQHGLSPVHVPEYMTRRKETTDRISKRDQDEKPLISTKVWNAIIIAVLSAIGTGIGTLAVDWTAKSAKAVKEPHHTTGTLLPPPPPVDPPKTTP